ncbi:MAG: phosphate ABC transporter ATP-binding protein PstB [Rhodothermales bacterium]
MTESPLMPDKTSTPETIREEAEAQPAANGAAPVQRAAKSADRTATVDPKIKIEDVEFWYGEKRVLKGISLDIPTNEVTAFIGPSGCGKSTLLRCINRMNELIPDTRLEGVVAIDGQDIYHDADPVVVRRRIGMVFQKPNPFPKTIYQNVAWGAKINGFKGDMDQRVEESLRQAALWDEVKDRLDEQAYGLSGGQQQRLCIARTLAVKPEVVLMDEPASALDPIATAKLEETIRELKKDYTIIIVTHNMQQASRVSDETAFFYMGELIEANRTDELFTRPHNQRTEDYITGRFG